MFGLDEEVLCYWTVSRNFILCENQRNRTSHDKITKFDLELLCVLSTLFFCPFAVHTFSSSSSCLHDSLLDSVDLCLPGTGSKLSKFWSVNVCICFMAWVKNLRLRTPLGASLANRAFRPRRRSNFQAGGKSTFLTHALMEMKRTVKLRVWTVAST